MFPVAMEQRLNMDVAKSSCLHLSVENTLRQGSSQTNILVQKV